MNSEPSRFFLVDGMALLFRSFYAMSRAGLTSPDGVPIGAVFGFLKVIVKVLREQKPSHLAVAWESPEKTFRHKLYPEYKANRKPTPEEIRPQIPLIQSLLREFGIPCYSVAGYEGDDVIGTLARRFAAEGEVYILSSDKDFMQLVDDRIRMFSLKSGDNYEILGIQNVIDYFGVPPDRVIDVLALSGDSIDNVPGVAGIGDKKAAALVVEFGSVEDIYAQLDAIADKKKRNALETSRDSAFLSRDLVTICTEVPVEASARDVVFGIERLAGNPLVRQRLVELRMSSILRSIEEAAPAKSVPSEAAAPVFMDSIFGEIPAPAPKPVVSASWGRRDYRTLLTRAEIATLCERIASPDTRVFAFDTETTGLDVIEDRPIGASFSFSAEEGFYVPAHEAHLSAAGLSAECSKGEIWEMLGRACRARSALAVAHNLKFDMHQLANVGVELGDGPVACSMVAAWLCDPSTGGYGLDPLSLKLLNLEKIPTSKLIGKEAGRSSMIEVPLSEIADYACEDVDATLRIWKLLSEKLRVAGVEKLFWDMEMPLLRLLVRMERRGVHVDSAYLQTLSREVKDTLLALEARIFELCGQNFNIASPKQLGSVLFEGLKVHEQLGFKGKLQKTSLGFKTDASVLEQFADHPVVNLVLDYRELSKLLGTYIDVLPRLVKPSTGRLHTDFHQIGTATGRLSSSGPNLQNIPVRTQFGKKVRQAFTASCPENIMTCADYSQIELRVLAHLANDAGMIAAFQSNADIHRETAAKIHGKEPVEITAEERSSAKAINFGIIYGMGAQRLAKDQGMTLTEAKSFIERYFANFSAIRSYMDAQRAEAHNRGAVRTYFGRVRPIPELQSPNAAVARSAENIAINTPVQGTAADIMKLGMLRVEEALRNHGLKTILLLQVHDEIVLEGPRSEAELVARLVREALEGAASFAVPLTAEVGQAENWLMAK